MIYHGLKALGRYALTLADKVMVTGNGAVIVRFGSNDGKAIRFVAKPGSASHYYFLEEYKRRERK